MPARPRGGLTTGKLKFLFRVDGFLPNMVDI